MRIRRRLLVEVAKEEAKKISKPKITEALFYIYRDQDLLRSNCPDSDIISCIPSSLHKLAPSVVILGLCSSLSIALCLYTLLTVIHRLLFIKEKVEKSRRTRCQM